MSTFIDINIPYAGGQITTVNNGSWQEGDHIQQRGQSWCYFGGDNGRKFFSLRVQQNEDYWFVEVGETSDLAATDSTKTVLYTRAINSASAGFYTATTRTIEMCKLSSSAVYIKIFTGAPGSESDSYHYVADIDESNGNEVTITDVTDQMPDWLRGGSNVFSTGETYIMGKAVHHNFMHYLEENKIVTYEANTHSNYGKSNFVERSWDPVTKSLTNRIVCNASYHGIPAYRTEAHYRNDPSYGYGDTWSFVPELDKMHFSAVRPHASNLGQVSNYNGYPVLAGRDNTEESDNSDRSHWINVSVGRDGLIHFSMATNTRATNAGVMYWNYFYLNTTPSNQQYTITYNPADGSWGTTGRATTDGSLQEGKDHYSVWLPLNVMSYADYDADTPDNDLSGMNVTQNSRVCKTWMFIGAASVQVQGVERGSEQNLLSAINNDLPNSSAGTTSRALQAFWLDYDHFIVFSVRETNINNGQQNYNDNIFYTIYRYYDENKIEHVSSGYCSDGRPGDSSNTFARVSPNMFMRISPTTFVSDKFTKLVSLSAGQG